jgi:hypothetical protein
MRMVCGVVVLALCVFSAGVEAEGASEGENFARGELLLTVAPPLNEEEGAYLDDIASAADAVVVKVYSALSLGESDPLLLLIRSEANDVEKMMELLKADRRVLSMSPNRVVRVRNTSFK